MSVPFVPERLAHRRLSSFLLLALFLSLVLFVAGFYFVARAAWLRGAAADRRASVSDADLARVEAYFGGYTGSPSLSTNAEPSAVDQAAQVDGYSQDLAWSPSSGPLPDLRLVLKNAILELRAGDIDRTLESITQTSLDAGGYIVSQRVWHAGGARSATITLAVPMEHFERILGHLRGLAAEMVREEVSGEDVTDQHVDFQSHLRNLQATRDRIRGFLDEAESVEEALLVNQELSAIEEQIEQVQGRLEYLRDGAAFSTITLNLSPVAPPSVPRHWRPLTTIRSAVDTLLGIGQILVDLLLWVSIVLVPLGGVVYVSAWGLRTLKRRLSRRPFASA